VDSLRVLRDGEEEGGSCSGLGFDPDCSSIAFNNPLANSQSNAGPAIFIGVVKSFEDAKDFLLVLGVDADTVVLN